jgi:hypothetical protein
MNRQLVLIVIAVGAAVEFSAARGAGTNAAEEAAIRKLIADGDQTRGLEGMPQLPDSITWTGSYKRPTVGSEKGELLGTSTLKDRVPGSAKLKTEPLRIVIADSRDLAYEYGRSTLDFDLNAGEHVRLETGILRVWQKNGGNWKQVAIFARPCDGK